MGAGIITVMVNWNNLRGLWLERDRERVERERE